jgi:hypothetical protein
MQIENERFLALAIHVQMASAAMEEVARSVAALRPDDGSAGERAAWAQALDELAAMNVQLGFMRQILHRAVAAEGGAPRAHALSS